MSNNKHLERLYEVMGQDAQGWLGQAIKLKYSADVMREALKEVTPLSQTNNEVRMKRLGYTDAFMMLTGYAFENLLKGIEIASNPSRVDKGKLNTNGWGQGGHGLNVHSTTDNFSLEKKQLLSRLEAYTLWAGRYNIPTKLNTYIESQVPVPWFCVTFGEAGQIVWMSKARLLARRAFST